MLSRDFVRAFLVGQTQSGISENDAKKNFTEWLMKQSNDFISMREKEVIISDLSSYTI